MTTNKSTKRNDIDKIFDIEKISPSYNEILKKFITVFGYRFSTIFIIRSNKTKTKINKIHVPIEFANHEKFIRASSEQNDSSQANSILPKMFFEVTGFAPKSDINDNSNEIIKCVSPDNSIIWTKVPSFWSVDITLNIISLNQEDGFEIIEQIIPDFRPSETWQIKFIDRLPRIDVVPVTLTSASCTDTYTGELTERRYVNWILSFNCVIPVYGSIYPPEPNPVPVHFIERVDSNIGKEKIIVDATKFPNSPIDISVLPSENTFFIDRIYDKLVEEDNKEIADNVDPKTNLGK